MKERTNSYKYLIIIGILVTIALIIIGPIFFLILNTFKPTSEVLTAPFSLPSHFTLENYAQVWPYMKSAFLSSLKVTIGSVGMLLLFPPMVAYSLSFSDFRGKRIITLMSLFGIFAIPVAGILPIMLLLKNLNLINTHIGLILVYYGLYYPIGVFIIREYYNSISPSLWEAAEIDGLSFWGKYRKIFFPLAKPMLIALAILMTVYIWNEYTLALVLLNDSAKYTVPLMLSSLGGQYGAPWGMRLAGIGLSVIPMVIIVTFFSDELRRGMSFGTVQ